MGLTPDGLSRWTAEAGDLPLLETTIGALLDDAAARTPQRQALVIDGFSDHGYDVSWTYQHLRNASDDVAKAMIAEGVEPGDRVGLWAPNVAEWLVVEFAVAKVGAVLVPLNPTYRAEETWYALHETGARLLFLLPKIRQFDLAGEYARMAALPGLHRVISLSAVAPDGMSTLAELVSAGAAVSSDHLAVRLAEVGPHQPAQIQFTSGTTGRPKGAVLTHRGLINDARQFAQRWQVSAEDRWANPMPLFHTAGCAMVTLACVANSATQCLAVWFDADRLLGSVERQRCTIVETVPTMVTALIRRQRIEPRDLSSVRIVGTGGAPVTAELGRQVAAVLGADLRAVYGLTETSPLISAAPVDAAGERGWVTAGPPLGHVEVKIMDGDGALVALGELGEVCVRGFLVMDGYLNRPEETEATIDGDGWLRTGDVGRFGSDGSLELVDRIKDIIIRGGENLYPAEIEALIAEHPAVLEVCVVGVPDQYYGEEACAVIRRHDDSDVSAAEVAAFIRARATHQKVPRHILFATELPTTSSGKVRKRDVAQTCRDRLLGGITGSR
jgi:fatty-acyl-CoA synthase